jgi:hypothetical protein
MRVANRVFLGVDGESRPAPRRASSGSRIFVGVDGEGQTVGRGSHHIGDHRYVFLAAASEAGMHWHVENDEGLSTETCFDFLLDMVPAQLKDEGSSKTRNTLLFAYSFGYDLTKILVDFPDEKLYSLFRPDERLIEVERYGKVRVEPGEIRWRGYAINLQGSKFTLRRGQREVTVWDIFKFYQSKFVGALKDWKVGDNELHERMQLMKDKRSEFDKLPKEQVRAYCFEECVCMAQLARKLVNAHEEAGLQLKSFYGAGSSASAMLSAMDIKEKIRGCPTAMQDMLACAFFGGRFENSVIGRIEGSVYNYDISSAYPYQITFLPCLEHGNWRLTKSRSELERARAAFVHYGFDEQKISFDDPRFRAWGPFPFRTRDGSISFPIISGGGWVGKDEYLAGERLFPHVTFREAWVYDCDCYCQPFARIPEFYSLRIKIGKEGPGIVLKLGYNACYGKLAQSVGGAVFSSWIWASLITSLPGMHKDWSNLLMIATDGVYTRERIETPKPRDTGTWELPCPPTDKCTCLKCKEDGGWKGKAHKPLGGWEEKRIDKGVFVARPGIYFPMFPTPKELKAVRGRGVGKGVVLENWRKIVEHWEKYGLRAQEGYPKGVPCIVSNVSRFCGAKSSISRNVTKVHPSGAVEYSYGRANGIGECAAGCKHVGCGHVPSYGQWIMRPVEMGFHPLPKRERLNPDGLTLEIRRFPTDLESAPYKKAELSEEARELAAAKAELLEQPDADFGEYDLDDVMME